MKVSHAKITIRKANEKDANLISILGGVTFYEAYFEQDDAHDLTNYIADSFAVEKIRAEIANPKAEFFIVFRNEKAVGYAKMRWEEKHESVKSEKAVELQRIYVLERVYGTKVGKNLLEYCIEAARNKGFDTIWLGVWEENKRAQKFYKKHGFEQVGTLEFPYGKTVGVNLVFTKEI